MKRLAKIAVVVAVVAAGVLGAGWTMIGHLPWSHGATDQSAQIATSIGASFCYQTGYVIQSRLDGSKDRIYDCAVNGRRMCVTEHGGIARDQTAMVKLLFTGTLSGGKPSCLP